MVLPNLTTNSIYEVKVRAASISTINPRQIILGSYSEPKKVYSTLNPHFCLFSSTNLLINSVSITDHDAIELRENPATATANTERLQLANDRGSAVQLFRHHFDIAGICVVAVSRYFLAFWRRNRHRTGCLSNNNKPTEKLI